MTVQTRPFSTILASAVILGSSIVGCSGAGVESHPVASVTQVQKLAPRVEKALADKDYDRALVQAEELVASAPQDAGYRALLGRTYLANGRYASARTAFQDAMTLGNRDVRTIVSLSLAEVGLGNARTARNLLADHIEDLPAADYGLAMAIAGNAEEGVRALVEAVRQPEATMQTRQNLAYALALGGAWAQARLIAGQDLSANEAEKRMGEWSRAGNEQQRVIAMLGVAPRGDDSGLPTRLALRDEPAPVQLAATSDLVAQARADVAAPAAQPAIEVVEAPMMATPVAEAAFSPALIDVPAVQETPAPQVAEAAPSSPDKPTLAAIFAQKDAPAAPLVQTSNDEMREAVREAFRRNETQAPAPVSRAAAPRVTAANHAAASDWVVQLGAFDSAAVAHEKWRQISRKQPKVGAYREVFSQATVNGRLFHRLAIRGFGDRNAAWAACRSLNMVGQSCFVRLDDTVDTRTAGGTVRKSGQTAVRQPAAGNGQRVAAR